MFDLPGFWSGWVIVLVVCGLAWLCWLLWTLYFGRRWTGAPPEPDPVWDENLREGHTPPPLWWFWLLLALLVFSAAYLMLYPGLGAARGALAWSQAGQLAASTRADAREHAKLRQHWRQASLDELAADPLAMRVARRLYANNCAACHGVRAEGQAKRFPSLRDDEWIWGDSEAAIMHSIRHGRIAIMPPWQAALGHDGVRRMALYVIAMSQGRGGDAGHADARAAWGQYCAACHGADGGGNAMLGAPSLRDDIWLYGGSLGEVSYSIAVGRQGLMPPQGERLNEEQMRLLAAWLQDGARGL